LFRKHSKAAIGNPDCSETERRVIIPTAFPPVKRLSPWRLRSYHSPPRIPALVATAVLIVNYRAYEDLGRCLASLDPHLRPDDEIVVVDYESQAAALCAAIAGRTRVVRMARADNLGFAAGVNLAAKQSRAPFLLLLNPDTIVEAEIVRELEEWLATQPDVGVAGARVLNANGTVQPTARRFPDVTTLLGGRSTWLTRRFPTNWFSRRNLVGLDAMRPVDVDWLSGACMMTRRDVFDRVGGFDESFFLYWEDADYCRRVAVAGFRRVYVPTVSVRHIGGRSAEHALAKAVRAFHRSAFRMYWKHASPAGRLAAPAVAAGLWVRGEMHVRRELRRRALVDENRSPSRGA
jgi:GT2 family glycosyltransferase